MEAKLKLAAAALLAAALGTTLVLWRGAPAGSPGAEPRAAAEPALSAAVPPRGEDAGAAAPPAPAGERRATEERPAEPAPAAAAPPEPPRLAGRVLDAEHGAVPGIRVRFTPRDASAPREAITDPAGAFALSPPAGGGTLDVASPGWTALFRPELDGAPAGREVVLVVAPSVALAGRIVDEQGRPLAGARVALPLPLQLRARFDAILEDAHTVERTAAAGPDGRFELDAAPLVSGVELETSCPGYLDDRRAPPPYDSAALEIVLRRAEEGPSRLVGRVVDLDGLPVAEAWVSLGADAAQSGADGAFALGLAPEERGTAARVLRAVRPGYLPAELARAAGEPWPEPLVLSLGPPPLAIAGRVLDADGAPVPGAHVWTDEETPFGFVPLPGGELSVRFGASVEGLLRDDPWTHRVRAGDGGRFALPGLLPRDYRVRVFDPLRLALATQIVAAGASDVELRLPAEEPRSVAGRIASLDGEPLVGLEVFLERPALGGGPAGLLEGRALKSDGEGRFAFEEVARAAAVLRVRGEELGLEGFSLGLAPEEDAERLDVRVPLRVHVRIDAGPDSGVERASLLDAEGRRLTLSVAHGEHAYAMEEIALAEGRSESFSVSETAATLVLLAGGEEVRRLPVTLGRGELNTLRP